MLVLRVVVLRVWYFILCICVVLLIGVECVLIDNCNIYLFSREDKCILCNKLSVIVLIYVWMLLLVYLSMLCKYC